MVNICLNISTLLDAPGWLKDIAGAWVDLSLPLIGPLIWGLTNIFFWVLDILDSLFKIFAGTKSTARYEGDIVVYLVQSDVVRQIFLSLLVLSFFLLIVFTIFAITKNAYSDKQEPTMKFINAAFKAMFLYILVPVATILCLLVGNVVLQAVDGATKRGNETSSSDTLFIATVYHANKLRAESYDEAAGYFEALYTFGRLNPIKSDLEQMGITSKHLPPEKVDEVANLIDTRFVDGTLVWGDGDDKWNFYAVKEFYHILSVNLLVAWLGGACFIGIMFNITKGVVSRVFKILMYYAISPAIMAIYPFDGGKALTSWRTEMTKEASMAYITIGVMNIGFSLMPIVHEIGMAAFGGFLGIIANVILEIIAFNSLKDMITAISGWFGAGDAYKAGQSTKLSTDLGDFAKNTGKKAVVGAAGVGLGAYKGAKAAKNAKLGKGQQFLGGVLGGFGSTGVGKEFKGIMSDIEGKGKEGAEFYEKMATTGYTKGGNAAKRKAAFEQQKAIEEQTKTTKELIDSLKAQRAVAEQQLRKTDRFKNATPDEQMDMLAELDKRLTKKENAALAEVGFVATMMDDGAGRTGKKFGDAMKAAKLEQEAAEKSRTKGASVENYLQAQTNQELLMEDFAKASGKSLSTVQANWDKIVRGSAFVSSDKKMKAAYDSMKSRIEDVTSELASTESKIQTEFANGNQQVIQMLNEVKVVTKDSSGNDIIDMSKLRGAGADLTAKVKAVLERIKAADEALEEIQGRAATEVRNAMR